jgi:restriction system protein
VGLITPFRPARVACHQGAQTFGKYPPLRIVLIDGQRLAMLMIEHNVGASVTSPYQIKKVDSD